ncbi:LysR family transcriptional regulator [Symbiobacterium terraclitae]|uniref:LysR family transcriptional regulator n=1 Tax=Symbiobacterium terraclitae TaxID=557451 RepID=UPI0035B501A7
MNTALEIFCTVAKHGSMSRAAAELHLSQPAISQRLRALEEQYGLPLFRRTNRGVELTPAGETLSRYAQRILRLERSLQEEMESLRAEEPRQIVVGATSAIGGYALPCTVYLFQQKYPRTRIHLQIGKRSEVIQRLEDGLVGMALVEGPAVEPRAVAHDWQVSVISEEDLVLITPATGPIAAQERFTADDLCRLPLIVREQGSGGRLAVEEAWRAAGRQPSDLNIAMELTSVDAIKTSVAAGHGVALVSKWCVRAEARMGHLRIAPLEGIRFTSSWTLLYPRSGMRSTVERALLRTLRSPAERGFC